MEPIAPGTLTETPYIIPVGIQGWISQIFRVWYLVIPCMGVPLFTVSTEQVQPFGNILLQGIWQGKSGMMKGL